MDFNVIRKTPARLAITKFLIDSKKPVDVESILSFLRSKNLNTNKVTIYRIMDFLYKNGFIERLEFGEGKFRYEIKGNNHHHHLICIDCDKIEDIEGEYMNDLENEIYNEKHFKVNYHSLEFFGICKNCQL